MKQKESITFIYDNLKINTNGTILGFYKKNNTPVNLIIKESYINPNTEQKVSIIAIGDNAFYNEKISSLVLPDSIITIGDNAFGFDLEKENVA